MIQSEDYSKREINNYVMSQYTQVSDPTDYKSSDMILCSKNKCNKHHKETCNCDGKNYSLGWTEKFGNNKWSCEEVLSKWSRGDIVLGTKPADGKWRACHGYSIHSVQGETFYETIYIDSRHLFDARMAYTAISRAKRWEQIKIIVA